MATKVAVIGAGPAGLACAYTLLQLGYSVDVFELDSTAGGLSRSIEVLGQRADIGPHRFFSKVDSINEFWLKGVSQGELLQEHRLSRILYNGKLFDYPLRGFDALLKLGFVESTLCVLSYLYARVLPRREASFEAWVSNAFGYRLYEHFFKHYSERLWGIPCDQLSSNFAKQRIKTLNLGKAIANALMPKRSSTDRPLSLLSSFKYPLMGSGVVFESIAKHIEELGGHIFYQQRVVGITTKKTTAPDADAGSSPDAGASAGTGSGITVTGIITEEVATAQGATQSNAPVPAAAGATRQTRDYDVVVSSGIFTDMVRSIPDLPEKTKELCNELRYRNTILVYMTVDPRKASLPRDHWIYVHSPEVKMGRMSDFGNWSSYMRLGHHEHLLCLEYWANEDEPLWQLADKDLEQLARADIVKTGLVEADAIVSCAVHRVYKSYPIYHNGYEETLKQITDELDGIANLYFIGRNGSYKYNNMDHSILMGQLCAQKIAGTYQGSLWEINTDSDYQELMQKSSAPR